MRILVVLLLALATINPALAASGVNETDSMWRINIPKINLWQVRNGNMMFPVATCPEILDRYEELNQKIATLKQSIKKDSKCSDEQIKVDNFSKVIEESRTEFKDLVAKGLKQKLSDAELAKIGKYIDQLAAAGGAIADLLWGSPCFIDDKKNVITVDLMATLLNEATSAYAALEKAPFSNTVRVVGKVTSSLMISVDKIVRARKAYDFNEPDQRKIFVKAMCSYNTLRPQFDEVTRTDSNYEHWQNYSNALKAQVQGMMAACSECKTIAEQYNKDVEADLPYTRGTLPELKKKFENEVAVADARFELPIGTQTLIDMRSLLWAKDNLRDIRWWLNDIGDIERDRMTSVQDVIEDFLFVKWQPSLVEYYQKDLAKRIEALASQLSTYTTRLGDKSSNPLWENRSIDQMLQQLYVREDVSKGSFASAANREAYILAARTEINRRLASLASGLMVIERHCTFTRAANLKYEQRMHEVCGNNKNEVQAYSILWKATQSTHKTAQTLIAVFEIPSPAMEFWAEQNKIKLPRTGFIWTENHLQSLVYLMQQLRGYDPATYRLK